LYPKFQRINVVTIHYIWDMYNGTDIIIFVDTLTPLTAASGTTANYRPLVCGTSNGFQMEGESIVFRNKCDGGFENSVTGYITWDFNVDGHAYALKSSEKLLKANFNEVASLMVEKQVFWARMASLDNSVRREGKVRISSYKETADMDNPYSFNVSFTGIGKPIIEATPAPPTPGLLQARYGTIAEGITLTEAIINAGAIVEFSNNGSVTVPYNFSTFLIPWLALPDGQPNKLTVTDLSDDQETPIGPTGTFGSETDIGAYDTYLGNFPTIYTGLGLRFNN